MEIYKDLSNPASKEFEQLLNSQFTKTANLEEGKIISYALSLENSRLWGIFSANSELGVMDILSDLPLTPFMTVEISLLTFYNDSKTQIPKFSLN